MAKQVDSLIGFADSALESYERVNDTVTVRVAAWNGKRLVITFRDVLALRDSLAGDLSNLVSGNESSTGFLNEALQSNFEVIPASNYEVYSFLNNEEEPALEVVAVECVVSVE